jgi:hypothetical protein
VNVGARDEITARQFGLENTMTVQIAPKSTQHTGMALSTQGSVAAWEVTFHLDGDESVHAAISIPLARSLWSL